MPTAAPTNDWIKNLPRIAYAQEGVQHPVGGELYTFHAISPSALFKLQGLAKPLGRAFTLFFGEGGAKNDQRKVFKEFRDPDGSVGEESTIEAIAPELAQVRAEQRQSGVDDLIGMLLNDGVKGLVGLVILDALRPRERTERPSPKDCLDFIEGLDLQTLRDYLAGVAAANKATFAPFVEGLATRARGAGPPMPPAPEPKTPTAS